MAKVLIVDDDESIREVYSRLLARKGHAVLAVNDGKQALDTLSLASIDAVILDYSMPEMNGLECLRQMKTKGYEIPVIFIRPFDKAGLEEIEKLSIYAFINKVSDINNLDKLIRQAVKDY